MIKYGALYNWYTVNTGKLAPEGWRVPTDDDWTKLEEYLIANGYNWDGSKEGDKIAKALAAKTDWAASMTFRGKVYPATTGTPGKDPSKNNASGFSALPGGYRHSGGTFYYRSTYGGYWWSATADGASHAWNRDLNYGNESLGRYYYGKSCGFSLRLVRDR